MYKFLTLFLVFSLQWIVFTNFSLVYDYVGDTSSTITAMAAERADPLASDPDTMVPEPGELDLCLPVVIPGSLKPGWNGSFDYNSYAMFVAKTAVPPPFNKPPSHV